MVAWNKGKRVGQKKAFKHQQASSFPVRAVRDSQFRTITTQPWSIVG